MGLEDDVAAKARDTLLGWQQLGPMHAKLPVAAVNFGYCAGARVYTGKGTLQMWSSGIPPEGFLRFPFSHSILAEGFQFVEASFSNPTQAPRRVSVPIANLK